MSTFGHTGRSRVSRIVVLPDYRGAGIGGAFLDGCCRLYIAKKKRKVSIVASHPGIKGHCRKSPLWKFTDFKPNGFCKSWRAGKHSGHTVAPANSAGRAVESYEFIG